MFARRRFATAFLLLGCVPSSPPIDVDPSTSTSTTSGVADTGTSTEAESSSSSSSSSSGAPAECGDGVVDDGEECDLGDANGAGAACLPDCVAAACGDGEVHEGVEACDDGNDDDTDSCTNDCALPVCGDGSVQLKEECDDGDANGDTRECKSDCTEAFCGDADVHSGVEACDDANDDNNDGCSELCQFTDCGDGFWNPEINEICDDGLGSDGDECNDDCLTWGQWTDTFNGTGSTNDLLYGVAFDLSGDVVVAGVTFDVDDGDDVWLRKYDTAGAEIWTSTYHSVTSDIAHAVAVAANDDIFVAGSSFTVSNNRDVWMRRFASDGTGGFIRTENGSANGADEARGIAIDGAGNVIVAGYTTGGQGRDIWVRKYNATGVVQWTRAAAGVAGGDDEAYAVATDSSNNVIVTGLISTGADGEDIWLRKYNSAGAEQWTRTHDGASSANDSGRGVAVDSNDDIVVAGYERTATDDDVWVRKYDAAGTEVWTRTYNGDLNDGDQARGVAIDAADEILVTGFTTVQGQSANVWLRRYTPDGDEVWEWTVAYNSPGFQSDVANAVAIDPGGNAAVAGFVTRSELGEARNTWVRYMLP